MKKYKMQIGLSIILALLFISAMVFFNNFVVINGEVYDKNAREVNVDLLLKKNPSLKNISYFNNLESLGVFSVDSETLEGMPYIETIGSLAIYCSDISNAKGVNIQRGIKNLHLFETQINVEGIVLDQVTSLDLISCKIENFHKLNALPSLINLQIYQGEFEGVIFNEGEYILENSTVFEDFDTIKYFELKGFKINDISGFINMDSLECLYIDKDSLDKSQIEQLKNNKIKISFDYIKKS